MRWNCMSKALHFLQITAEHQDYPFFTVFLTTKSLSQNISITLLQISLKLHEHRGRYWRKKLPWMILEEQFPVPRYTAASKIGNSVISLLWQLRCRCNPDHNKFSSLSNTTVVAIFPNLCLWRRSLCSNLGGIDPKKLYRATLRRLLHKRRKARVFVWKGIRKKYHFLLFLRIHNKSTTTTPKCTLPQRLVIKELKPMLFEEERIIFLAWTVCDPSMRPYVVGLADCATATQGNLRCEK